MSWLKFNPNNLRQFPKEVEKEIKLLEAMQLENGYIYKQKEGGKKTEGEPFRIVTKFGFPHGAITEDTEYDGELQYDEKRGIVIKDTRMFRTPNSTGENSCFIHYMTAKDLEEYKQEYKIGFHNIADKKVSARLKKLKVEHKTTTVGEFALWAGWKISDGPLEGEKLPDTTPRELTPEAELEYQRISALVKAGQESK